MLKYLLSPLPTETFFAEFYERKHCIIRRNDKEYYQEILTCLDLDDLLYSTTLHHPAVRVVDHSLTEFPDAKTYTVPGTTRIDPLKFTGYYAKGSTLAMAGLHERIFGLRRLTNEMAAFFLHPFQANIYLTPANSQGFSPHYDTHDVFVLQFEGSKKWRIYDGTRELAAKSMPFDKDKWEVGEIVSEFTLHQGDLLYIPRGVVHDAYCDTENSGHITLGLTGKTWAEFLAETILKAANEKPILRKYPAFGQLQQMDKGSVKILETISELLLDTSNTDRYKKEFMSRQRPLGRGHFLDLLDMDRLCLQSSIRLREKYKIGIIPDGETITVNFYNVSMTLPAYCQSFLERLLETDAGLIISELECDLDEESKLDLARELLRTGMISVEEWSLPHRVRNVFAKSEVELQS